MLLETHNFEFGEFVLDRREKVLFRNGAPVPVAPKVLQLLLVLIENHDHIVEKEKLMEEVWADSFVEESNLTYSIRQLRKVLGDDTHDPRFIETVPRRGYRFIAVLVTNGIRNDFLLSDHSGMNVKGEKNDVSAEFEMLRPLAVKPVTKSDYMVWSSIAATLIFGLAAFFWLYTAKTPVGTSLKFERLTSNGKTKCAAVSPDGKFVVYVLEDEDRQSLWLKNVAAGSDVQILPPAENTELNSLTFSPDGNFIYYVAKESLYQQPVLGGTSKKVIQNFGSRVQTNPITFSPDGKQFAFVRQLPENEAALVLANSDGTDERILASSKRPQIFLRSAAWSPDGKVIAVAGVGKVLVVQVADGAVSSIPSPGWSIVLQIAWQKDGNGLFVIATKGRSSISHQIWSLSYPTGDARNITNDLNNYQSVSLTADGINLVTVRMEQIAHIWAMSGEDASQAKQLTHGIDRYDGIFGLNWLPDGNILYETVPRNGNGEIWMVDAAGRNSKQLVDEAGSTGSSPDGAYIVFQSEDSEGTGLFRLNLSDGERKRLTTGVDVWLTFSPDGKWLVYTRWGEQVALWKISIEGGEAIKLTNISDLALTPTVSPDGRLIAFQWGKINRNRLPEIALLPFDGGEVIKLFSLPKQFWQGYGKNALQWTPDGQAINYIVHRDGASNIWRQPIDGNPPYQVTTFLDRRLYNFAYSPDGKRIAMSRGTLERDAILITNLGK